MDQPYTAKKVRSQRDHLHDSHMKNIVHEHLTSENWKINMKDPIDIIKEKSNTSTGHTAGIFQKSKHRSN